MKKHAATVLVIATSLFVSMAAFAGNIRDVSLPSPQNQIQSFGYNSTTSNGMLAMSDPKYIDYWRLENSAWSTSTRQLRDKMSVALGGTGFDTAISNVIINMCKVYTRDPRHCVLYAASVACAESSCAAVYDSRINSIYGIRVNGSTVAYPSRTHATLDWIKRYNQYWYTANEGYFYNYCKETYFCGVGVDYTVYFFYSDLKNKPSTSRYCMSEDSSGAQGYCPNGFKNAFKGYQSLLK